MIIEIPGEITFSRTYNIPPLKVELPLAAHARTGAQVFMTVILLCLAMPCLVLFVMFLSVLVPFVSRDPFNTLLVLSALSFLLLAFLPRALLALEDVTRRGPILVIEADGIVDRRAGITIPWTDVTAAQIVQNRNETEICLNLGAPMPPRAFFDRGGTGFLGRRKADRYHLVISRMNVRPHVLGKTILSLVQRSGGAVKG